MKASSHNDTPQATSNPKDTSMTPRNQSSTAHLYKEDIPVYSGEHLKMISFPLGGIGTGTIGLGGRGELRDWEIHNGPNLGYRPPHTMPWIFCRQGKQRWARILERRLLPHYHDSRGLPWEHLCGLPRLREAVFLGTYPVARVFFEDDDLPVDIELEAFNPMIPGRSNDSAIPAAILVYKLTNRTDHRVSGSIALSLASALGEAARASGGTTVAWRNEASLRGLYMSNSCQTREDINAGTLAAATLSNRVTWCTHWDEPGWWDRAQKVWNEYSRTGRCVGPTQKSPPTVPGAEHVGMLSAEYRLDAHKSTDIVFLIGWSFPWRDGNYCNVAGTGPEAIHNHYATRFPEAFKALRHVAKNFHSLRNETLQFEKTLFESSLPGSVLDAVSSQMSIIRTNTTMWLDGKDESLGRIHAFEGCDPNSGCCPMNCTHVWNYEQSLAHLYPSLERTMRLTDYEDNLHHGGAMSFRTALPLDRTSRAPWRPETPAADGQFGTVVKVYREWRISGNEAFLRRLWPGVQASLEFAWKGRNRWDADKDGVMEGVQHNTYDIEFHGPNTICGSLYIAALAAGAEMARAVGDDKAADTYQQLADRGAAEYDRALFNGEYYIQDVQPGGEFPDGTPKIRTKRGNTQWPKYQYGYGCLSDQLLGQWAAHVAGLGHILPEDHVRRAIGAVYRHNFREDLSHHESVQRTYALNDEAGLLACTWPKGKREEYPFPYSDEVWTGIEYQVAAHLIFEGMVEEGLQIVAAVRNRHDGKRRNPWNEFECGDHYARAMSSWSLLLALSGQRYDGRTGRLWFRPEIHPRAFRCLVTANDAYGLVEQTYDRKAMNVAIDWRAGKIKLREILLEWPTSRRPGTLSLKATLGRRTIDATLDTAHTRGCSAILSESVILAPGERLRLSIR